jgi:hypothetical protein
MKICPDPRLMDIRNKLISYDEDLLAPRPTLKLEDRPMSAVRDCLFNIFVTILHEIGRAYSTNRGEEECIWDIGGKGRGKETTRKTKM